ncbi:MAG TPA: baseplate J/gp47 family protein [Polyangiaceae bacterium]|nr:baseplate J/gp47 family protein [Polyangiaceae bacterium]
MPLLPPILDARRYQELFDEVLSRIPVHTPEWTNFNASDPGVTLAALFAFLTENSLYMLNRAPENLRRRFLERLELGLQPGAGAQAIVSIANERGPIQTVTLDADLEVRAAEVPFRTTLGLDVLPLEARAYLKKPVPPSSALTAYYTSLYTSFLATDGSQTPDAVPQLYETVALPPPLDNGVDLATDTVDRTLWVALLVPAAAKPPAGLPDVEAYVDRFRTAIAGKTLSIGIVPVVDAAQGKVLAAGGTAAASASTGADAQLTIEIPRVSGSGGVEGDRQPVYRTLLQAPVPTAPAVLQVLLPSALDLRLWNNLDPLEPGTGDFPPVLENTALEARRVTWLRIRWPKGATVRLLWCGINATFAAQRKRVATEVLPAGTGRPDQKFALAHKPVVPGSVQLTVTVDGTVSVWSEVSDLTAGGPEVSAPDPQHAPGTLWEAPMRSEVFALDAEAGILRFGDGMRGKRPPANARLVVSYDYSVGAEGNVGPNRINQAPALPPGLTVSNALPSWGGADAESPEEGQKQVARWLQHRDRLVTEEDFRIIPRRAPGLEIGRIEVLSLYDARLGLDTEPGSAPGVVTLLVVPKDDPVHPDTPEPSAPFLQSLCNYLEPRRLLTTEIVVRGPIYIDIWISVGIGVAATQSAAVVREAVTSALSQFLSPLPAVDTGIAELAPLLTAPDPNWGQDSGWPWRRAVTRGEIVAAVARVPGVVSVSGVKLAAGIGPDTETVPMGPLNFPRLAGLTVVAGTPLDLDQIRGTVSTTSGGTRIPPTLVPVPVIPKEC